MPYGIIYDVYRDGEYIGDYLAKDLQEKFQMSKSGIYNAINEDRIIRGHYKVIKVDSLIPEKSPLFLEFDTITKLILERAGRNEQTAEKERI